MFDIFMMIVTSLRVILIITLIIELNTKKKKLKKEGGEGVCVVIWYSKCTIA